MSEYVTIPVRLDVTNCGVEVLRLYRRLRTEYGMTRRDANLIALGYHLSSGDGARMRRWEK